jgi:SAM-dependent methyltransferase
MRASPNVPSAADQLAADARVLEPLPNGSPLHKLLPAGPAALASVRDFYDEVGWRRGDDGVVEDTRRFGVKEVGPIRRSLHDLRLARIREAIVRDAPPASLLECGCGGNPAMFLAGACEMYTGVDFSSAGLDMAEQRLAAAGVQRAVLLQAELGAMPFADNSFDAAYSAHALYHIPDADAQAQAMNEIMRVIKPGGVAVLVLANPRPLLFPGRLLRRLLADTPGISWLLNKLRRAGPLPYKPMPLGWMRRRLARHGEVRIGVYAIASVWFDQHITEHKGLGRLAWKIFARLERSAPALSAHLGNFVIISVKRTPAR